MKKVFVIVGDDARQRAAGEYLQRLGYPVLGAEQVYQADFILLPLPLDEEKAGLARLLRAAKPGAVALGGRVSEQAMQLARSADVTLLDYFKREELEERNAIPTAEGCLAILLQQRSRTLWRSPVLVLGYGRVGRAVAQRLQALGAQVTVAARRPGPRAQAESDGCQSIPLTELEQAAPEFDAVVNTIPAPVLGPEILVRLAPKALVVDLASKPGGTDFEAARAVGVRAIHALSLPARCAPVTAGQFVAQAVLAILQERGELTNEKQ